MQPGCRCSDIMMMRSALRGHCLGTTLERHFGLFLPASPPQQLCKLGVRLLILGKP